jgi:hypothetical protein
MHLNFGTTNIYLCVYIRIYMCIYMRINIEINLFKCDEYIEGSIE